MNTINYPSQIRAAAEPSLSRGRSQDARPDTADLEPIGSILVNQKKLDAASVPKVLAEQLKDRSVLFGQLAVKMQLCEEQDVRSALGEQASGALMKIGHSKLSTELACAYTYEGDYVRMITELRFNLLLNWIDPALRSPNGTGFVLAVISPCAKDGRSVTSANLAISFAQLGRKTLLLDCDLRNASQANLFGLARTEHCLSDVLRATIHPRAAISQVAGIPCLDVLTAGSKVINPQDLIGRSAFERTLQECRSMYDIVIVDTPAGNLAPEMIVIARLADAALALARDARTDANAFDSLQSRCQHHGVNMIGSVMIG